MRMMGYQQNNFIMMFLHLLFLYITHFASQYIGLNLHETNRLIQQADKCVYCCCCCCCCFVLLVFGNISFWFVRWRSTIPFHGWTSGSPPCFSASRKPYRKKRAIFADFFFFFSPWALDGLASLFLPWASDFHFSSSFILLTISPWLPV